MSLNFTVIASPLHTSNDRTKSYLESIFSFLARGNYFSSWPSTIFIFAFLLSQNILIPHSFSPTLRFCVIVNSFYLSFTTVWYIQPSKWIPNCHCHFQHNSILQISWFIRNNFIDCYRFVSNVTKQRIIFAVYTKIKFSPKLLTFLLPSYDTIQVLVYSVGCWTCRKLYGVFNQLNDTIIN